MTMTNILYHGVTMTTMVKMMTFEKPCCHIMLVLEHLHTSARLTKNFYRAFNIRKVIRVPKQMFLPKYCICHFQPGTLLRRDSG